MIDDYDWLNMVKCWNIDKQIKENGYPTDIGKIMNKLEALTKSWILASTVQILYN